MFGLAALRQIEKRLIFGVAAQDRADFLYFDGFASS
jgi:hypothetical protein